MNRVSFAAALLSLALFSSTVAAQAPAKTSAKPKAGGAAEEKKPDPLKGLALRNLGPAFMSGRIADVAIHPKRPNTWYVAVGSGGVWRTDNGGTTWKPIFDDQGSYSTGCVTLDPSNPEIVWVGTGENVSGRHVGYGDGVYRSADGGVTWKNMGLPKSEHIGKILVDPRNSNVVYVASQGPLWSAGGERGLYRTKDGGASWEKVLGGGDYTGVNDVVMDPRNPDVLYASTHQRFRNVAVLVDGGPESAIHKSVDGGATWRKLTQGLPKEDMGKIGLAISPQNPDVVYAAIELAHRKGGFYRTENGGGSWEKKSDQVAGGTGPHYYQEIYASPHRFDRVYFADVRLSVTEDGGKTFTVIEGRYKHVDNHVVTFVPHDPDYLLVGCDGGLYETRDLGKTWKFIDNLPVTQYYKVAVDNDVPFYNVYGGTQDNNTQGGPSRTDNVHGIRNSDWFIVLGGDGHQPACDPEDPNIVYAHWQGGNLVRHDRRSGENIYIQPQPAKGEPSERFNWDAPIVISPQNPATIFHASQRVWRSDDRGDSWRAISGDLTRNIDRLQQPVMGQKWGFDAVWDLYAMSRYSTITSLSQSALDEKLIYAGTDDGLIQVTEDGGGSWRRIDRLPGVAPTFFVNDIKADLHDAGTVYVAVDQHKTGDFAPYLFKSVNRGRSWTRITSGLPPRHLVWRVVQDPVKPSLLFAGTEFGLFHSTNGGASWSKLSGGMPNIAIRDLVIQKRENDLVCASFGRGFFVLDDLSPLREVSDAMLAGEASLLPVRKAWAYTPRSVLDDSEKASQGDGFFTAPNPPFGAVFTYYLKDEIRMRKGVRQEKEKAMAKDGAGATFPSWDEIRAEEQEEDPALVLTVRDAGGNVVRRLSGPVQAGFQRVAWDLRYPAVQPWSDRRAEGPQQEPRGALVPPGTYQVSLARRHDGVLTDLGVTQSFEVVALRERGLEGAGTEAVAAFQRETASLRRSALAAQSTLDETARKLKAAREALMRSTLGDAAIEREVREMERRVSAMREKLSGQPVRDRFNEDGPVPIMRRLQVAMMGTDDSSYGPTPTHRMSYDIARDEFEPLQRELDTLVRTQIPALERKLDQAGVPWTPGRGAGGE